MLAMILSACASSMTSRYKDDAVIHIVIIWLKEAGNQGHIQEIVDVTRQLGEIPEIQEVRVGKSIPSSRQIVDDSFDVGIHMTFANQTDLGIYLAHEKHKDVVATVLKPLTKKILVYDISAREN